MTASRFNGDAAGDLKDEAEILRAQYRISRVNGHTAKLSDDVDEIVIGGVRCLRYPDGRYRDDKGHEHEFDPGTLFPGLGQGGADFGFPRKVLQYNGETFVREVDGKFRNRQRGVLAKDPSRGWIIEYDHGPGQAPATAELPDTETWNGPAWEHPRETFETLNFAALADDPIIHREWVVPGWIPMFETTGFVGPGGDGKTLSAQMLATSVATGRDWLGLPLNQMKVACVFCEDYSNDAYWRQNDINRKYGLRMADLDGRLLILPRRKKRHNYLAIFDGDGELHLTTFFSQLLAELKRFGAKFVVIDTRADVFRGDQNDEHQARTFVRRVTDVIAQELSGAVLLLYQPSRSGRSDGSHESGSVQWDSAFRCRLILSRRKTANDNDEGDGRTIERRKSNFARSGEKIDITWRDHVFERDEPVAAADPPPTPSHGRDKGMRVFLTMLDLYNESENWVSSDPTVRNYAPRLFSEDETKNEGCSLKELTNSMHALLRTQHVIKNEPYGRSDRLKSRLVRVP
jgi:RecA-family ATPase